jgi:hypothetical protein
MGWRIETLIGPGDLPAQATGRWSKTLVRQGVDTRVALRAMRMSTGEVRARAVPKTRSNPAHHRTLVGPHPGVSLK